MNVEASVWATAEIFRPWDDADERKLRARILRCQRVATQRVKEDRPDQARTLYWIALEMASQAAFAPAKVAHLEDVILGLARLFQVAVQLERWEAADGN